MKAFILKYRNPIIFFIIQSLLVFAYYSYRPKLVYDAEGKIIQIDKKIDGIYSTIKLLAQNDSIINVQLMHYPAIHPIPIIPSTRISSTYNERVDPINHERMFHWGIDYLANIGTPVYATGDGIINNAGTVDGYGKNIKINHGNGYESSYSHLSEIDVAINQDVKRGDIIGRVGSTGKSTGNHLHYEILYLEKKINPNIFIN